MSLGHRKCARTDTGGEGGLEGMQPPPHQHLRYFLSIILCIIGAEQVVMCAASAGFIFVENGYYGHFGV